MTEEHCENCKFFDKAGTVGWCRRRAPEMDQTAGTGSNARWPFLESHQWCGEFQQKAPEQENKP